MFINLFSLERSQTWQNKKPLIMNEACLRATSPGYLGIIYPKDGRPEGGQHNWSHTFAEALQWVRNGIDGENDFGGAVVLNMNDFNNLVAYANQSGRTAMLKVLHDAAKDISESS